jgi:hypothetical protein
MADTRNASGVPTSYKGFFWTKIIDAMVGSPAQGDILYRDASVWTRLAAGTSGNVLRSNGAAANPSWGSPSGISGGAMSYVTGNTVTGSAATTLTVSGLDLDAHEEYYCQYNLKNGSGSTSVLSLTYNSDTTATNYDNEFYGASGGTDAAAGANNASIIAAGAVAGRQLCGRCWIRRNFDGLVCAFGSQNPMESSTPTRNLQEWAHLWRTAATNVTGITIVSSIASALSVGCYFKVWKITT